MMSKKVLDVCCGSRMFYFNKKDERVVFNDKYPREDVLCDGRKLEVNPDFTYDFTALGFPCNSFNLVIFDPPHLLKVGESSWLAKKYGKLTENWRDDIRQGFKECFRVLKPYGTLVFKWNEDQIKQAEILKLTDEKPIFGHIRQKTHFIVFMKG